MRKTIIYNIRGKYSLQTHAIRSSSSTYALYDIVIELIAPFYLIFIPINKKLNTVYILYLGSPCSSLDLLFSCISVTGWTLFAFSVVPNSTLPPPLRNSCHNFVSLHRPPRYSIP